MTHNSKNFQRGIKKTRPKTDYGGIGKTISRFKKKQKINVKMPHVNKKALAKNEILVQTKNYA